MKVVISTRRIMAAIESGEHVGFCVECGKKAHGVEPDARNYECKSCGKMSVFGAEELLIA
jgi:DNA-directed RNA polymerase subunit RPC12/RpoP